MKSFILLEKPADTRKNRLIIVGFIFLMAIISYIVYSVALYGMNKMNADSYNAGAFVDSEYRTTLKVVCAGKKSFRSYVAINEIDKEKGLSVFTKINENDAMLFVFDKPEKYSFWMKDMKFPIDIVWLNQDNKIVDMVKSVAPITYPEVFSPKKDSLYVLEFNAGTMDKLKIKIGDACIFDISRVK